MVGDKTGSGNYGVTNDIAIIWPPHCAPLVVAIYFYQNNKDGVKREDILAKTVHILINTYAQYDKCIQNIQNSPDPKQRIN